VTGCPSAAMSDKIVVRSAMLANVIMLVRRPAYLICFSYSTEAPGCEPKVSDQAAAFCATLGRLRLAGRGGFAVSVAQ
jgi:hypothetical protein